MVPKVYSKNGCVPCKTRRKKCDEARPACRACVRIGLLCSYGRAGGPDKNTSVAPTTSVLESDDGKPAPPRDVVASTSPTLWTGACYKLLEGLDFRAFQQTMCESFVVNACELGWNHDLLDADRLSTMTIRAPLSLTSPDEFSASRAAWQAYCYYIFGKEHHVPAMLMRSRSLYSEVLTMLYSVQWDGHSVETGIEMIVAATFLTMLEMRASINPKAWVVHNQGVQAMVTRLGPHVFAHPQRLSWFESSRWAFVFATIIQNKLTDLDDDAWLTIPWSRLGAYGWDQRKPMEQQMLDLILSGRKRLRGLLALTSAPDWASFKRIMTTFWLDYDELLQTANDWRNRHRSRVTPTDWLVHPDGSRERELFPHGVPLFATPVATVSVSWYYIMFNHLNAVTAFVCVLMAELQVDSDEFELDSVVHWLWSDDPETEQDILAHMYDPGLRATVVADDDDENSSSASHSKTLWLAMADRLLELSRYAARMECSVIVPLIEEQPESFFLVLSMIALIPAIHTLGDDPLGLWARDKCLVLLGGEAFKDIMEMTEGKSMVEM